MVNIIPKIEAKKKNRIIRRMIKIINKISMLFLLPRTRPIRLENRSGRTFQIYRMRRRYRFKKIHGFHHNTQGDDDRAKH